MKNSKRIKPLSHIGFDFNKLYLLIFFLIPNLSWAADNSIYATLSNQVALKDELDITANNIANSNTSGFKRDMQIMSSYNSSDKYSNLKMPSDIASISDFSQGSLNHTQNPLNLAINGKGFFMIETQDGMFYTRNGNFFINNDGYLVDQQGNYVLSEDMGQIFIPLQNTNIFINQKGYVYSSNELLGIIGVFDFEDLKLLKKAGSGYFKAITEPFQSEKFQLLQGFLEESNAKPIIETTRLVDLQKSFSISSNMVNDVYAMQRNSFKSISR